MCFVSLYRSSNLPQPHHKTSWDFHSSWSCVEWSSSDRWQVTGDMWHMIFFSRIFWYRCYYPHTSRHSVSPVCGILKQVYQYLLWGSRDTENTLTWLCSMHTEKLRFITFININELRDNLTSLSRKCDMCSLVFLCGDMCHMHCALLAGQACLPHVISMYTMSTINLSEHCVHAWIWVLSSTLD